ncbi:MAG: c-type cytochrome, partial [Polyangiaceae bacterium]|nr:c-type cytochrome [Polyangiaceae bacterium]
MAAYASSFGGPLDGREIDRVVAYIRSFQQGESLPVHDDVVRGDAAEGRGLYATRCADCHGSQGGGATAISLNSPVFQDTASDGQIRYAIAKGRPDTPMPAFEGDLEEGQIDSLVAFVRTLRRTGPPRQRVPALDIDYDDLVIHPDGPAPEFTLREGRFVPAAEVAEALESGARMIILDARPTSDWLEFHIPGAVPTPYYAIESLIRHVPRDGTFVVAYCGCPHAASGQVIDALRRAGFPNTAVLDEGVFHWRDEGYPLASGNE